VRRVIKPARKTSSKDKKSLKRAPRVLTVEVERWQGLPATMTVEDRQAAIQSVAAGMR
jgi:hypothetical protein